MLIMVLMMDIVILIMVIIINQNIIHLLVEMYWISIDPYGYM